jgi:hypothetical protein
MARTPPGRSSFAKVTSRWMARIRRSRTGRTVSRPPACARLPRIGELPHTANSPPTGWVITRVAAREKKKALVLAN